ncbi:MAG: hypothetical protein WCF90_02055 [Methanomicrobiales archaeon]
MFGNATTEGGQQGRDQGNGTMAGKRTMNGPGADHSTAMGNMTRQHGQGFKNGTAPPHHRTGTRITQLQ